MAQEQSIKDILCEADTQGFLEPGFHSIALKDTINTANKILLHIQEAGLNGVNFDQLVILTGLNKNTISIYIRELEKYSNIYSVYDNSAGRPKTVYFKRMNPKKNPFYLGDNYKSKYSLYHSEEKQSYNYEKIDDTYKLMRVDDVLSDQNLVFQDFLKDGDIFQQQDGMLKIICVGDRDLPGSWSMEVIERF